MRRQVWLRDGGKYQRCGSAFDIQMDEEATTHIRVGDFRGLVVVPLRGPEGDFTRLLHGAAAFREDTILAKGTGTRWQDPEMRQWESGGHAEFTNFDWSA